MKKYLTSGFVNYGCYDESYFQRERCAQLNSDIEQNGLSKLSWGNASIINDDRTVVSIKASGVALEKVAHNHIVDVNPETMLSIRSEHEINLKPSIDLAIHLTLYELENVKAIIHMHSLYATVFAQNNMSIHCIGTTHADSFPCDIPVVANKVTEDYLAYESYIGDKILDCFKKHPGLNAVLLEGHGAFVVGASAAEVLENAITLEYCAQLAYHSMMLHNIASFFKPQSQLRLRSDLQQFHYERKHGINKRYGQ